jgi:hypothetical protein
MRLNSSLIWAIWPEDMEKATVCGERVMEEEEGGREGREERPPKLIS